MGRTGEVERSLVDEGVFVDEYVAGCVLQHKEVECAVVGHDGIDGVGDIDGEHIVGR